MKVKDLIAKLQTFDPELPVAIADWNEQYRDPSEEAAESIGVGVNPYYPTGDNGKVTGMVVIIGVD